MSISKRWFLLAILAQAIFNVQSTRKLTGVAILVVESDGAAGGENAGNINKRVFCLNSYTTEYNFAHEYSSAPRYDLSRLVALNVDQISCHNATFSETKI